MKKRRTEMEKMIEEHFAELAKESALDVDPFNTDRRP